VSDLQITCKWFANKQYDMHMSWPPISDVTTLVCEVRHNVGWYKKHYHFSDVLVCCNHGVLGTAAMMVWCGLTTVGVGVPDIEKRCNTHRMSGNAFCIFGAGRYTCIFRCTDEGIVQTYRPIQARQHDDITSYLTSYLAISGLTDRRIWEPQVLSSCQMW
jgi:hypothetical protein